MSDTRRFEKFGCGDISERDSGSRKIGDRAAGEMQADFRDILVRRKTCAPKASTRVPFLHQELHDIEIMDHKVHHNADVGDAWS